MKRINMPFRRRQVHPPSSSSSNFIWVVLGVVVVLVVGFFLMEKYREKINKVAGIIVEDETKTDKDGFTFSCNFIDSTPPKDLDSKFEFSETAGENAVVKEILDKQSLAPNFVVIAGNTANAEAVMKGGQRYIIYNSAWMNQHKQQARTNWAVYGVLAHEIGHHLNNHSGGSDLTPKN